MSKNFLTAIVVGAVVLFITGYLIFELALGGFYEANQGSAMGMAGVMRDSPLWLWFILSILAWAAVLALAIGWAGATDAMGAFKIAAVVALLVGLSYHLGQYSWTNLDSLTIAFVDPIISAVHSGISGAVMGIFLGKGANA